jgi:hypothetical protein
MPAYLFLGSFCTGKTTIIRRLASILRSRGFNTISMEVNINHGPAYLVTRFIVASTRYRYIGNYYLTLRFNNPRLFCKYLPLMMLLDALFIPLKYTTTLLRTMLSSMRKRGTVILIDEYYPNAIVDYEYFANRLCGEKDGLARAIYSLFYKVAISHTIKTLKNKKFKPALVVLIALNPLITMELWRNRERSRIFDYVHFLYRTIGSIVLASSLGKYSRILLFRVNDPRRDGTKILKSLIRDIVMR